MNDSFERNFGNNGPYHRPLGICLPWWHPTPPKRITPDSIVRFQLRTACLNHTDQLSRFVHDARHVIIAQHPAHFQTTTDLCCSIEHDFHNLCIRSFHKCVPTTAPADSFQLSISSRMWQAHRKAMTIRSRTLPAIFRSWQYMCTYTRFHHLDKTKKLVSNNFCVPMLRTDYRTMYLSGIDRSASCASGRNLVRSRYTTTIDIHCHLVRNSNKLSGFLGAFSMAQISTPLSARRLKSRSTRMTFFDKTFAPALTPVTYQVIRDRWMQEDDLPSSHWSAG